MGKLSDYIIKELEQYGKDICEAAEKHFFGEGREVIKKWLLIIKKNGRNFKGQLDIAR